MPIDPLIALGYHSPQIQPPQIQMPLEFARFLSLRNLMRQGRLQPSGNLADLMSNPPAPDTAAVTAPAATTTGGVTEVAVPEPWKTLPPAANAGSTASAADAQGLNTAAPASLPVTEVTPAVTSGPAASQLSWGLGTGGINIHSTDGEQTWLDERGRPYTGPTYRITRIGG